MAKSKDEEFASGADKLEDLLDLMKKFKSRLVEGQEIQKTMEELKEKIEGPSIDEVAKENCIVFYEKLLDELYVGLDTNIQVMEDIKYLNIPKPLQTQVLDAFKQILQAFNQGVDMGENLELDLLIEKLQSGELLEEGEDGNAAVGGEPVQDIEDVHMTLGECFCKGDVQ